MRAGDVVAKWPIDGQVVLWRGGPGTTWARKKPVTFEDADLDHSFQGWDLAEEHTMRVALTEEGKTNVVLVVVDAERMGACAAESHPPRPSRRASLGASGEC